MLLLPSFSAFVQRDLAITVFNNTNTWVSIAIIFVGGVICAGLYPSMVMSGFKPVLVLKGNFKSSKKGTGLRRGLVTFQFIASIILITGTLAMYWQINFMQKQPLGMDSDRVLVVRGPNVFTDEQRRQKNSFIIQSLSSYPYVDKVSIATDVPGHSVRAMTSGVTLEGQSQDQGSSYRSIQCDENFVSTYGLNVIAGRNFTADKNEEWQSAMVTEAAMKQFGINDPADMLGKTFYIWEHKLKVVGVLQDYHQESLKQSVDKIVFICDREVHDYISIKFTKDARLSQLISVTGQSFEKTFPENTFEYFFMDDYFAKQYASEVSFGKIMSAFSILATLISCLGLFGLSSYMIIQRTKEIGIRKILGATVLQIVALMSKEYLLIIVIANVISWPVSWLLIREWLSGYAYRIDPGVLLFLIPGISALMIAFITIATQSMKAAIENPVKSLRTE
jgi:putative ABC transport system permease protein